MPLPSEIASAVAAGQFAFIAPLLDARGLQATSTRYPEDWPLALHMLGHIFNDDLEDARFLYKQAPSAVQQGSDVAASFRLLQGLWNNDYEAVWPNLIRHEWPLEVQTLVQAVVMKLRERYLLLMSRAYSHITVAKASVLLGLPESDAISLLELKGYVLDPSTRLLVVKPYKAPASNSTDMDHLKRLTKYAVYLGNS